MVFRALRGGFSGLRGQGKLVAAFFAANFCFALLMAWPMSGLLDSFAANRLQGAALAEGIDFDFVTELLHYEHQAISELLSLAVPVAVGYVLFSLFLSGGALTVLAEGRPFSASLFWGAAAGLFGPLLRLFLWSLLLSAVFLALLAMFSGLDAFAMGGDAYESTWYWTLALLASLAAVGFMLIGLFMDYGRISIVLSGQRKARRALVEGMRFTLGRLPQTVGLALALLLLSGAGALAYRGFSNWLDAPGAAAVWGLIFLQQLYILWRTALRLARYGGEMALFGQSAACSSAGQEAAAPEGGRQDESPSVAPLEGFQGQ